MHLENCPNVWSKFCKYIRNWPWKKGRGKKVWSLLSAEKEAFLLFVLTVLPAIWLNCLCIKHPSHHCAQLNYIYLSIISLKFNDITKLQASAFWKQHQKEIPIWHIQYVHGLPTIIYLVWCILFSFMNLFHIPFLNVHSLKLSHSFGLLVQLSCGVWRQ